jgi:hypothetical protein
MISGRAQYTGDSDNNGLTEDEIYPIVGVESGGSAPGRYVVIGDGNRVLGFSPLSSDWTILDIYIPAKVV